MADAPMPPDPGAQSQGPDQGQGQVPPDQALQMIQVGIQSLAKASQQMDPDLAKDFQMLQAAFQDFAQSAQEPAGQPKPQPKAPNGPMPENAGAPPSA